MYKKAIFLLESGEFFSGYSFGHEPSQDEANDHGLGEVVFNTSITGYQEILTDPSYKKQIIVMTYPEIGNYGVHPDDNESELIHASGLIVKNYNPYYGKKKGVGQLQDFLKNHKIPAIFDVDTRKITKIIRDGGAQRGIISTTDFDRESLLQKVKTFPSIENIDLVKEVTTSEIVDRKLSADTTPDFKVAVYDYGIKRNIIRHLENRGCQLRIFPANSSHEEIIAYNPDGVFLSNGPGDPSATPYAVENVKKLIGKYPIFGICFGHQILSQAYGYTTSKLKFGHRGGNQPVLNKKRNKIEITAQNHGFVIDGKAEQDVFNQVHLNDGTISGFDKPEDLVFSVQYHPESSPGPHDSHYLFDDFVQRMKENN